MLKTNSSGHLKLVESLQGELPPDSHVEHLLSQLGDYAALAERSKSKTASISGLTVSRTEIDEAHGEIVAAIADTVRWGFVPATADGKIAERVGVRGSAITDIAWHRRFISACFQTTRAGLHDRRGPVRFFTTNYDTLLEDALALNRVRYWDGFEGGAVAYRAFRLGDGDAPTNVPAHVIKLHGSIDWHLDEDAGRVLRVRDGDSYPTPSQRVLIYPQSTKYLAAQRDPFAAQFDLLRRALATSSDNALAVCGYSFGDDHINQEIEIALSRTDCKTTLIAFCREEGSGLPECLQKWRASAWGARVYIATQKGLYAGSAAVTHASATSERRWWTFAGVTEVLQNGAGSIL
jgi:hypothetical protein